MSTSDITGHITDHITADITTDRTTGLPADAALPRVIEDPVAYLATFGIESELVAETSLPAAA